MINTCHKTRMAENEEGQDRKRTQTSLLAIPASVPMAPIFCKGEQGSKQDSPVCD